MNKTSAKVKNLSQFVKKKKFNNHNKNNLKKKYYINQIPQQK